MAMFQREFLNFQNLWMQKRQCSFLRSRFLQHPQLSKTLRIFLFSTLSITASCPAHQVTPLRDAVKLGTLPLTSRPGLMRVWDHWSTRGQTFHYFSCHARNCLCWALKTRGAKPTSSHFPSGWRAGPCRIVSRLGAIVDCQRHKAACSPQAYPSNWACVHFFVSRNPPARHLLRIESRTNLCQLSCATIANH